MELREFIKTALLDITSGVEEANKISNRFKIASGFHQGKQLHGEDVVFDVAVEIDTAQQKTGKAGLGISVVSLGGEMSTDQHDRQSNRLKFRIFVTED